ncbi:MAG: type II toxin-antitoxin system HicA family toxin [Synergistaceae bacterium]|nr:type II toxin-antitoxin system HicA family toxin [Synergistaceae bacterium]
MGKVYSQKEFIAEAMKRGWSISTARGKGSHVWCFKDGERPFPIPQKIKDGINAYIKKRLGITK